MSNSQIKRKRNQLNQRIFMTFICRWKNLRNVPWTKGIRIGSTITPILITEYQYVQIKSFREASQVQGHFISIQVLVNSQELTRKISVAISQQIWKRE
jgi:hypothetical protein